MDSRTREYLAGRFGDHYRRVTIDPPAQAHAREWGYIPWDEREGTTMVRHRSLTDIGGLGPFLERTRPRHVYYSAGRYGDPSAPTMADKEWRGSDLIFDLDADHLPTVNPDNMSYREMLAACKTALTSLLDLLIQDFGINEPAVAFSGGRGYHVHVSDQDVLGLDRRARRDIAEYVRGEQVNLESILETAFVSGAGRVTPAPIRRLDPSGGWSRRVHEEVLEFADELTALGEEKALNRLTQMEGIGDHRAQAILKAMNDRRTELEDGNVDIHPAFVTVLEEILGRTVRHHGAAIDEPVTTDLNRLIRLPGSLHGGSGLAVIPLSIESVETFDPLSDAIPETFRGNDIAVEITTSLVTEVGGTRRNLSPGAVRLPEFVAIHLMARGEARKIPESAA